MPSRPDTTAGFVFHGPLDQGRRATRFHGHTVAFRDVDDMGWYVGTVLTDGVCVDGAFVPLNSITVFVDLNQVKV